MSLEKYIFQDVSQKMSFLLSQSSNGSLLYSVRSKLENGLLGPTEFKPSSLTLPLWSYLLSFSFIGIFQLNIIIPCFSSNIPDIRMLAHVASSSVMFFPQIFAQLTSSPPSHLGKAIPVIPFLAFIFKCPHWATSTQHTASPFSNLLFSTALITDLPCFTCLLAPYTRIQIP